jgi:hypothetical protein
MEERLVVLTADDPAAAQLAQRQLADTARIMQRYGPHVFVVEVAPELVEALQAPPGVIGIYEGTVPAELTSRLDETGRLGVAAWNERHTAGYHSAKRRRKGEGLPWDDPDFEPEG